MSNSVNNDPDFDPVYRHRRFRWLATMALDFVFLDAANRSYYCRKWGNELWLFYWHKEHHWVSLRRVTEEEVEGFPRNLLVAEQQLYHGLHATNSLTRGRDVV